MEKKKKKKERFERIRRTTLFPKIRPWKKKTSSLDKTTFGGSESRDEPHTSSSTLGSSIRKWWWEIGHLSRPLPVRKGGHSSPPRPILWKNRAGRSVNIGSPIERTGSESTLGRETEAEKIRDLLITQFLICNRYPRILFLDKFEAEVEGGCSRVRFVCSFGYRTR